MKASKLRVYDPPMCCSSGACGPGVNPELARFSSDLDWLAGQGVAVERYNMSSNPAAFAEDETIRDMLRNEGNSCLPILVVDGRVVRRGAYPPRTDLARLAGLEDLKTDASAPTSQCAPGCSCDRADPPGKMRMKMVVCLLALAATIGIVSYKILTEPTATTASQKASTFSAANSAPAPKMETKTPAPNAAFPGAEAVAANAAAEPASTSAPTGEIGETLSSFGDLNKLAASQDAAFIYFPMKDGGKASAGTREAMMTAQNTMKTNKVNLGLYTLPSSSTDYAALSAQIQAPAVIAIAKGKGMTAVTGEITEAKLLQAFMAVSRSGGCGPASPGCGPTGGCN